MQSRNVSEDSISVDSPRILTPRKALNPAFRKVKPERSEIETFKTNLDQLLNQTENSEHEEHHKNNLITFLKNTWYHPNHFINTKGRSDLVIHTGKKSSSPVGVLLEAKKPGGSPEMVRKDDLNRKALHELLLYYLRERISEKNLELKYLVATDVHQWFIFDAGIFEKLFARDKALVKRFEDFTEGRLAGTDTSFFYNEIAKQAIASVEDELEFTWFDLSAYSSNLRSSGKSSDAALVSLYKVLSPEHLLKLPFVNDSNTLDRSFYAELLHIIGLEEVKEQGKHLIRRKPSGKRDSGSLLESAIFQLDSLDLIHRLEHPAQYGANTQERLFNVSLELVITWINRILFLKLLEGQLLTYHKGDKSYEFLNSDLIHSYDDLNTLFFSVLAKRQQERNDRVKEKFARVPYLNSSLFEVSELEHETLMISNLHDDQTIPVSSSTVLKNRQGKRENGNLNTLAYLFRFLNAYDFSGESSEDIQEENKTLINASVLGLIFEKINGYKEGSFFTPGFITEYMARETIRKAVIQKFNDTLGPQNPDKPNPNPPKPEPGSPNPSTSNPKKFSPSQGETPRRKEGQRGSDTSSNTQNPGNYQAYKTQAGFQPPPAPPLEGGELVGSVIEDSGERYNNLPYLKTFRKELRNNMTPAEVALWKMLKGRQLDGRKFRRQHSVGNYILDFYCPAEKLAVELDGQVHFNATQAEYDYERDLFLKNFGIKVLRFENKLVFQQPENVLDNIRNSFGWIKASQPKFSPSQGEMPRGTEGQRGSDSSSNTRSTSDYQAYKTQAGSEPPPAPPLEGGEFTEAGLRFGSLNDVYEAIGREFTKDQANDIINGIKICDPAVGSGHFLVSALNELIAIKSELKILQDEQGRTLRDYDIRVANDELVITDDDGQLFEYHPGSSEKQRVQETLFREKQTLIENCLFGVDINPNSVKICRLRLWIELLKNAYYKNPNQKFSSEQFSPWEGEMSRRKEGQRGQKPDSTEIQRGQKPNPTEIQKTELETLPNIDINIKCGNSLVSRFELDADLKQALRKSKWNMESYRTAVQSYREATDKSQKREMQKLITDIKSDFRTEIHKNDPKVVRHYKLSGELHTLLTQQQMFEESKKEKKARQKKQEKLEAEINKLAREIEEIKESKIYENAFEWRFEFPEVLDDDGKFTGFDVVIGNPPYIRQEQLGEIKPYLKQQYEVFQGTADIYAYFIELGIDILRGDGVFKYIVANKWMRANYGKPLRNWLRDRVKIEAIYDFGDLPVFDEATTYPCLLQLRKAPPSGTFHAAVIEDLDFDDLGTYIRDRQFEVIQEKLHDDGWALIDKDAQLLLEKIRNKGTPLGEYVDRRIYYGIKTGLNEAFVIDDEVKNRIIYEDPKSKELIKPFLAGRDIKRYQPPEADKYLILIPNGWTDEQTDAEDKWAWFREYYPAIAGHLAQYEEKAKKRYDKGKYWWELRACDYYEEFEKPKIILPDISLRGNFTLDKEGEFYVVNTAYIIVSDDIYLLGVLASSLVDFYYRNISSSYRGGYLRFIYLYLETIPIAEPPEDIRSQIEEKVERILDERSKGTGGDDTSELEGEVDRLVWVVYGLSEEEIAILNG